jgi:hypothetical protein
VDGSVVSFHRQLQLGSVIRFREGRKYFWSQSKAVSISGCVFGQLVLVPISAPRLLLESVGGGVRSLGEHSACCYHVTGPGAVVENQLQRSNYLSFLGRMKNTKPTADILEKEAEWLQEAFLDCRSSPGTPASWAWPTHW